MSDREKILEEIERLHQHNDELAKEGWYDYEVLASSDNTLMHLEKFIKSLSEEETRLIHTIEGEVVTAMIPNALSLKVEGLLPKDTPLRFGERVKLSIRKEN